MLSHNVVLAPARHARAGVAAGTATVLGVAAHRLGHGMSPSPAAVVVGLLVLHLVGATLARRERGLPALAAFVGLGQLGLHVAYADSVPHEHMADPAAPGGPMLVLHVVAALLLAAWLRAGEQAVWTLLVRLAGRRPRLSLLRPPATVRVLPVVPAPRVRARRALLLPVGRRGPPLAC